MDIEDILSTDRILTSLEAGSKKHALQALSGEAANQTGVAGHEIFDVLLERERLGTTGVGSGVAIPHGTTCTPTCVADFTTTGRALGIGTSV